MGVNTHHDDYFESLFRRTTASFRAKVDKENIPKGKSGRHKLHNIDETPTTSKTYPNRQRVLHDSNHKKDADSTTTSGDGSEDKYFKPDSSKYYRGKNQDQLKTIVENIVTQMLKDKFSEVKDGRHRSCGQTACTNMGSQSMKTVVSDLVNRILQEKLSGQLDSHISSGEKLMKSVIEDIVTEKLKEHLATTKSSVPNPNRSIEKEALMSELLADTGPKSKVKQRSPNQRVRASEWEKLVKDNPSSTGIKRLPRTQVKAPEWQQTDGKTKSRSNSVQRNERARSPAPSSSGRSSRSHVKGNGVLIPRSISHGRSNKPSNADPVALYQYYKNEWEHFRKQIPGESNHQRLRWHLRQRLMDPQ